jgi:RimJ/RimL family protein N-acetyltransferase
MATATSLTTEHLLLRPFGANDLDAWASVVGDRETMRHLGGPKDRVNAWQRIAITLGHRTLNGFGMWAVEERETGDLVGRVGLQKPEGWPQVEVAWTIARSRWGRGYAPEAALASLEFGFERMGFDHIISLIDPANTASIRVAEKIGEKREGQQDFAGTTVDVYGIHGS